MDQSDLIKSQQTLQEIARAQKILDQVESKMKKFRSRKKQNPVKISAKVPYPDIHHYFSHLEQAQNNEGIQFAESQCYTKEEEFKMSSPKPVEYQNKENDSLNINQRLESLTVNQRLEKQKKSSIYKLEEYYFERNEALEEQIRELKDLKGKIIKDQKLLLRNNEDLDNQIHHKRNERSESTKLSKLQLQFGVMRNQIALLEEDNMRIGNCKQELQKHIQQNQKGQKTTLKYELQVRPKSSSEGRCKYH